MAVYDVSFKKVVPGIYEVFFGFSLLGHVISTRAGWIHVPTCGGFVYFGMTRMECILPRIDFKYFLEYEKKYPFIRSLVLNSPPSGEDN